MFGFDFRSKKMKADSTESDVWRSNWEFSILQISKQWSPSPILDHREKHFQALTLEVFTALSLDEEIFGSLNMMSYYSEVTFDVDWMAEWLNKKLQVPLALETRMFSWPEPVASLKN